MSAGQALTGLPGALLGRRSAERERGSKVMLFLPPACGTGSIRAYTEAKTSFAHWATLSGYTVYT